MTYRIILSSIASHNLEDAIKNYSRLSDKKVVRNFLKEYRSTYKALQINPFYQFHDNNYRFLPFKKFPYIAFFKVDELSKTVFLNAIFHTSQDTSKHPKL